MVFREDDSEKALRLREGILSHAHHALSLDVLPVEAAHALLKAERRKIAAAGQAMVLLGRILEAPIDLRVYQALLPRAMHLASIARGGVYDCLYVALAEAEKCDLVTADERLLRALPDAPIRVLSDLPE